MKQRKTGLAALLQGFTLAVLILCPLIMIFGKAVMQNGRLDFTYAWRAIINPDNLTTIRNSLLLSASVTLMSTAIAAPLAYLTAKTSLGRHRWLNTVLMIPFMTPPYIASMGWILFMQKRGLLQQLLPLAGSWTEGFFSFFGLALVMSLHVFPFMLGILRNAIQNLPASLDESGAVFGGNARYRLRRIHLPLLTGNYAIGALLVFVKTLSEYGTPATLGKRIGFMVFTTQIHQYATVSPIDFGKAASLSSVLILICMLLWLAQGRITARHRYMLVGGKGNRVKINPLTPAKKAGAWAFVGIVLLVSVGVPYFSIIATSLIKLRSYGLSAGNFTLSHYVDLFTKNTKGIHALQTSMLLAVSSASIAAVLGTWIVMVMRRIRGKAGKTLEGMALLPEMLPGIVLVIGIMLFWNRFYRVIPLYNTPGIMVVAYVTLFLPYTIQYVGSAGLQIGESLSQAGRTLGGSPWYVFGHITLPLLARGILAGWTMTFIISFRELVTASILAPPNMLVISTFIMQEFDQGSVSVGMAMAVVCVVLTTSLLLLLNRLMDRQRG